MPAAHRISHEPEANVLRIEIAKKPIDHAREVGNVIVNFSKEGLPVYIEILESSNLRNIPLKKPQVGMPVTG